MLVSTTKTYSPQALRFRNLCTPIALGLWKLNFIGLTVDVEDYGEAVRFTAKWREYKVTWPLTGEADIVNKAIKAIAFELGGREFLLYPRGRPKQFLLDEIKRLEEGMKWLEGSVGVSSSSVGESEQSCSA